MLLVPVRVKEHEANFIEVIRDGCPAVSHDVFPPTAMLRSVMDVTYDAAALGVQGGQTFLKGLCILVGMAYMQQVNGHTVAGRRG